MAARREGGVAGRAVALLDAVLDDPAFAAAEARALRPAAAGQPETLAVVDRVLGIAAASLGAPAAAAEHLRASLATAEAHGLADRAAEARMTLALPLLAAGQAAEALASVEEAMAALSGVARARAQAQRGLVLQRMGDATRAQESFRRALPVLRSAGDVSWEIILRTNRGILHTYRRNWTAAERDLRRAVALADGAGQRSAAAVARCNLGFLASWRGDLPQALAAYDAALKTLGDLGRYRGLLRLDRADVLLSAGLAEEAYDTAAAAVDEIAGLGVEVDLAEARLSLAQAALAAGDPGAAHSEAETAQRAFATQARPSWQVLARYVALRAQWAAGVRSAELQRAATRAADALERAGWALEAGDARLIAARAALARGRRAAARRALAHAAELRRRGPAALRVEAWHAEALRRLADGDRRGAFAAAHAGLRVLDRHQAAIGASELRVRVAGHGGDLARLGLRLARAGGDARRVLTWAERWRAGTLRLRPVRPPDDRALADDLAALRATAAALDAAALAGEDTAAERRRLHALEEAVRRRARHAPGVDDASPPPPDAGALCDALGSRALVELVDVDGTLHAVVLAAGRARLRALGGQGEPAAELDALRFALRRLARRHGTAASLQAAADAARHGAARLDALLLAPLCDLVGDRELVIVPTGALHATPWSLLPSCTGRPVSVAPSASAWLRAGAARARPGAAVLVGADDPPHAAAEVGALARLYPGARRLTGARATAARVTAALDGAALAHVACHGLFRADNPLFSYLRLADGPLTVYDLERLGRAPHRLVLSACESGLSGVAPGDELMGLAASVFALGTASLVASVVPVADEATLRLMVDFHGRMRAGEPVAAALAAAQAAVGDDPFAAAAGFVCFGAG